MPHKNKYKTNDIQPLDYNKLTLKSSKIFAKKDKSLDLMKKLPKVKKVNCYNIK